MTSVSFLGFLMIERNLHGRIPTFTSGFLEAVLTVHHAFIDPHAVPGFHGTQRAAADVTLPKHKQMFGRRIHTQLMAANVTKYIYVSISSISETL